MVAFLTASKHGPFVGMVLSVWQGSKKPRLATQNLAMKSVNTLRVVQLTASQESEGTSSNFQCGVLSRVHMIRHWHVMCILDVSSCTEEIDGTTVVLSKESMEWMAQAELSAQWWPEPANVEAAQDPQSVLKATLPGSGKFRKKRARGKGKKEPGTKVKKVKKVKKDKIQKPPEGSAKKEVEFVASKFRKNDEGRRLVKQCMGKAFDLDAKLFQNKPLFNEMGLCRLRLKGVENVKWASIVNLAVDYFCAEHLGC